MSDNSGYKVLINTHVQNNSKCLDHKGPWFFIPHLSFMQGIPIILVAQVTAIIFKSLGFSNQVIGLTSMLTLPMSLKFFFGPIIDRFSTKRNWILIFQFGLGLCFASLALVMYFDIHVMVLLIIFLTILATITGFHDIAVDGFYVETLTQNERAFFIGIKTAFMRLAIIFTTGFLVMIAGKYAEAKGNIQLGWSLFFFIPTVLFVASILWHAVVLPKHMIDPKQNVTGSFYIQAFKAYFTQRRAILIIVFILLYRAGEGLLARMAAPFFMDTVDQGGLGISVSSVGFMYGSVGMIFTIIGGFTGGYLLKKFDFKKTMIAMALCMTLPNLLYIYLAYSQPLDVAAVDLSFIPSIIGSEAQWKWDINLLAQICIAIESFGYGMGYSAFLFFVCQIAAQVEYKASFFSISTGLSTLGWMLIGTASGFVQATFGYTWLFIFSVIFAVPGIICLIYLVYDLKEIDNNRSFK